ncbi:MAG: cupin domain-containing protein [Candidatus Methanofastidiosa archaeon]|nr:cupin domain-containing protein [Candidatus Methanofastidiosa archaeon]
MFKEHDDYGFKDVLDGITMQLMCHGEHTLLARFKLMGGSELPIHKHPYEQTGFMLSGHMKLTIGDEIFDVKAGDSWCIPLDVVHGAHVLADSMVVEVFSPPREDYLKLSRSDK